jgi:hypothetical protein
MLKFKWTDELVQEFTREVAKGQNAMFKGCPKLTDKITAFKRIHSTYEELLKSAIRSLSERKFNDLVYTLNSQIEQYETMKSKYPQNAWHYDFEIEQYRIKLAKIQDYRK